MGKVVTSAFRVLGESAERLRDGDQLSPMPTARRGLVAARPMRLRKPGWSAMGSSVPGVVGAVMILAVSALFSGARLWGAMVAGRTVGALRGTQARLTVS